MIRRSLLVLATCTIFALLSRDAHAGLVINPTFSGNITSSPNSALIQAGINAAIARAQNAISTNVTANILFDINSTGLGQSSTFVGTISYSNYRTALQTKQTLSARDITAIASLPNTSTNPVNGDANVQVTTPLLRALGFNAVVASDSTITLNTTVMNLQRTGTQNPSFYDLQAVAAHEIDEVLGIGGPATILPTTTGAVGVEDLFRYSAAGVRSFTASGSATSYLSYDAGATSVANFNQNNVGDYADWGSSATPRVQDAFGTPGVQIDIGTPELTAFDIVGYDVVPEPSMLCGAGLMLLGLGRRRRQATVG